MIKLNKCTNNDIGILKEFNLKDIDNCYLIYLNTTFVGVIEYKINEESICIEYIDIIPDYRRKGIASKVISIINPENKYYIYGNSLPHQDSFNFWKSLGADFDGEDEYFDKHEKNKTCIPFLIP